MDLDLETAGAVVVAAAAAYYFLRGKTVARKRDYKPTITRRVAKPKELRGCKGAAHAVTLPDGSTGTVVMHDSGYATNFDPSILDDHQDALE